ncbi:MAG: hypothetical protein JNL98_30605 [Bryobacterales bacterium]|nr:hypothetical protein [Bryobacterales bacterium]
MKNAVVATILLTAGVATGADAQPARLLDQIGSRQFQPMNGVHPGELEIEKAQGRNATTSETLLLPMVWNGTSSTQSSGAVVLLTNTSAEEATVRIEFFDASGARVELPMLSPAGRFRALDGTVSPQSVIGFVTSSENEREQKLQARVVVSPASAITVGGFLMVQRESMAVLGIPAMAPRFRTFSTVAMVSSSFNGNVVVANGGTAASTVTLSARSEGQTLCRATFTIPAQGARDLSYRDSLPCMRSFEGIVLLTAETTGTATLAFGAYNEVNQTIGSVVPNVR